MVLMWRFVEKMKELKVKIKLLEGGKLPEYKRDGDVCLDCYAREDVEVSFGEREFIPLGFALELPEGYEAVVRPRSGLSFKGLEVAVGTVDMNYRGEVKANLTNNSYFDVYKIKKGDRVCQLAIREVPKIKWKVVGELSETERGGNGFGSSGK